MNFFRVDRCFCINPMKVFAPRDEAGMIVTAQEDVHNSK